MTPTDKPTQVGGLLPLPELPEATAWTYRFIDLRPNASGTWGRWLFATEQPHRPVHPHEFEVEPLFTASQMHTYAQANVQALESRLVALEKERKALWQAINDGACRSCESGAFNNIDEVAVYIIDRVGELMGDSP
jgi:hypothetical protein